MSSLIDNNECFFTTRLSDKGISVAWQVNEFSSLLNDSCKFVTSPSFKFQNSDWQLLLSSKSIHEIPYSVVIEDYFEKIFKRRIYQRDDDGKVTEITSAVDIIDRKYTVTGFLDNQKYLFKNEGVNDIKNDCITVGCEVFVLENNDKENEMSHGSINPREFYKERCDCSLAGDLQSTYNCEELTDVILKVAEQSFPAHKVILSSRSKVFKAMFQNNMKEKGDNVVDLIEMDPSIAKAMLTFVYSGEVGTMSIDKTLKLYTVADRYMLDELKESCREFLIQSLSTDNVFEIAAVADLHSDQTLKEVAKRFLAVNVKETLIADKWTELSKTNSLFYFEFLKQAIVSKHFI